jgi:methyl-accepting chemotaxis protein
MSVSGKIVLGLVIVIAIISAMGVFISLTGIDSVQTLTHLSLESNEAQKTSSEISRVLNAHFIWRQRLTETVLTGAEFTGSLDPDNCALGQWLKSDSAGKISDPELLSLLQMIHEPHAYIHTEAQKILNLVRDGDSEGVKKLMTEDILPKTQEVISLLTRMQARSADLTAEKGGEITQAGEGFDSRIATSVLITGLIFAGLLIWMICSLFLIRAFFK